MPTWTQDDSNLYGRATGLNLRGRHKTVDTAFDAALKDLLTEKNDFFDSLADRWKALFPGLPAWPGRYEDGKIFVYVRTAPTLFLVRPKLKALAAKLAALPGAPKKVDLRLEIHARPAGRDGLCPVRPHPARACPNERTRTT